MSPETIQALVLAAFALPVVAAAVKDLASFTIPNWISASLAAAFVPAALLCGLAAHQPLGQIAVVIGAGLGVGLGVFALAAAMFALGWVGGGDAKLMAAAALWVGLPGLAPFAVYTAIAGGALALGLVALRSHWLRPFAESGPAWARRLATPGEAAPYGVAIAVGALIAFALHPLP